MQFQKGHAKLGGRKPGAVNQKKLTAMELYEPATETARESLTTIAGDVSHAACVAACREINDRAYGKPMQAIEQHTTGEYRIVIVDAWRERPPAEIEIQANDTKALK